MLQVKKINKTLKKINKKNSQIFIRFTISYYTTFICNTKFGNPEMCIYKKE